MKIGLYGVSRAGKSYLIDQVLKHIDIKTVHGSELLSKISGTSIDKFKKLPLSDKDRYRRMFINELEKEYSSENLIIDGHYSFIKDNGYEIAFTEDDLSFYDVFIYLDTPANVIIDRLNSSNGFKKNTTLTEDDINKWKEFEINNLKNECRKQDKDLLILSDNLDENINWIKDILEEKLYTSSLKIAEFIISKHKNIIDKYNSILLLDCDKTLSLNDSTINFFEHANFNKDFLKHTFKGDKYSLVQFRRVAYLYSSLSPELYNSICKIVAENELFLAMDTINYLKYFYNGYLSIGITAGIKKVWEITQKSIKFPQIIEGGNYFTEDDYSISDEVKRILAKKLQQQGKYVVALGDSLVDLPMLMQADEGFVVAYNSLNRSLEKQIASGLLNIKQWKFSQKYYKGLIIGE